MRDDLEGKRKIVTRDGHVGWVVKKLTATHSSVQIVRNGYYRLYNDMDLEDITEEEFKRRFR